MEEKAPGEEAKTVEPAVQSEMPFAVVEGTPMTQLPLDLYIPPDALEVILEAFEGPLDLLLYLIRRQNLDILEIRKQAEAEERSLQRGRVDQQTDGDKREVAQCDQQRRGHAPLSRSGVASPRTHRSSSLRSRK